jgi:Tol biopolymer transport system component
VAGGEGRSATDRPLRPTALRPLTGFPGIEWGSDLSPDGSFIAYAHGANGPLDIYVQSRVGGGQPLRLVSGPSDETAPRWSPDGSRLAFTSNRGDRSSVYLVASTGGPERRVADTGYPPLDLKAMRSVLGEQPWSSDGAELTFSRRRVDGVTEIVTVDVGDGSERVLWQAPRGAMDALASWSPDEDRLAYVRWLEGSTYELRLRELATATDRLLASRAARLHSAAWAPDGERVLFGIDRDGSELPGLWSITVDGGEEEPILFGPGFVEEVTISENGHVACSTFSHVTDLYLQPLDGRPAERLTEHPGNNMRAHFSPDGNQLAYLSSRTGDEELWLLDLATGEERLLTEDPATDEMATWSPDGNELAFRSDRDGRAAIWLVDARGLRTRRLSPDDGAEPSGRADICWSPDGRWIGFLSGTGSNQALHLIDRDGLERGPVLEGVQSFGWYLDSSRILYTSGGTGDGQPAELRARNLESGEEVVLLQRPLREIRVARDGSMVSYCRSTSHFDMNLEILRLLPPEDAGGLPRPAGGPDVITHGQGEWHVHNGDISPDSAAVVYTRDTDSADLYELEGLFRADEGGA